MYGPLLFLRGHDQVIASCVSISYRAEYRVSSIVAISRQDDGNEDRQEAGDSYRQ